LVFIYFLKRNFIIL